MRNNKKNWEIFNKGRKENATIYDHFLTHPALITTTFNNGDSMMVETMNEGRSKYKVDLLNEVNLNKNFLKLLKLFISINFVIKAGIFKISGLNVIMYKQIIIYIIKKYSKLELF